MNTIAGPSLKLRQAAVIAGAGLLVMAVCAPYAEFYVFSDLLVPRDAVATYANLSEQRLRFVSALAAVLVNYVGDIIVAWALCVFFSPVNRDLSLLAAVFQWIYAGLGLAALTNLFAVSKVVNWQRDAGQFPPEQVLTQMQWLLDAYRTEWGVALVLFGLHLILIGYLAIRANYVPGIVGYLLVFAGSGYVVYVLGGYILPDANLALVSTSFLLEPVFMIWLLWKGRQVNDH